MISWENIIQKYNIEYKLESINNENEIKIVVDSNIKSLGNDKSIIATNLSNISIITLNVMATKFSNYVKKTYDNETNKECIDRYNNIIKILCYFVDIIKIDFIFLQEVDTILLVMIKTIMNRFNYSVFFSNNDKTISKNKYGNCIVTNKNKYKLITYTILKITPDKYIKEDTLYSIKAPRYTLLLYLNNIKTNDNIILSTVHLTGLQNRTDIRKDELVILINKMLTLEKTNLIICGDFNEDDINNFNNVVNSHSLILQTKILFNDQIATSYHKWNLDRKDNRFYKEKDENIYKNLDHIITSNNYKIKDYILYPNFKNGVFGLEVPYKENEPYDKKNWCSDHALIYAVIKKK